MALRLLVDVELLVVNLLRASTDVTAFTDQRIATTLYDGADPSVVVSLPGAGDERVRGHLDAHGVQLECFGGNKATALDLARTARAYLTANTIVGVKPEGVLTSITTRTLPWWSPDEGFTPPRARYIMDLEVVVHPNLT